MEAGGLLCSRYFLNVGAGLPARCQGAALAPPRTSSFAAKLCARPSSSFPRFLCQCRQSKRQDPGWAGGRTERAPQPPVRTHSGLLVVFGIENYILPGEWVKDV